MTIILILTILWWLSGSFSFIYWWTKEFDLETGDIMKAVAMGLLGPLAFPAGWLIHGGDKGREGRVLIRKRK